MAFWIEDIKNLLGITVLMVEHDMKPGFGRVRPRAGAELRARRLLPGTAARGCQSHPDVVIRAYLGGSWS